MKTFRGGSILQLFGSLWLFASMSLSPAIALDKWGVIDKSGTWVIPPQYKAIQPLPFGNFCLEPWISGHEFTPEYSGKGRLLADNHGRVLRGIGDDEELPQLCDGLVRFKSGRTWGFKDKEGKVIIPPNFTAASNFLCEFALVRLPNGKYQLINTDGKAAGSLPPTYTSVMDRSRDQPSAESSFEEMTRRAKRSKNVFDVPAKIGGGFYRFICYEYPQHSGQLDLHLTLGGTAQRYYFSEGLAHRNISKRKYAVTGTEFIDRTGRVVIGNHDTSQRPFHEGYSAGLQEGRWCFMNRQGVTALKMPTDCRDVSDFNEGLAAFAVGGDSAGKGLASRGTKFGYVNKVGSVVIPPLYLRPWGDNLPEFAEGLAAAPVSVAGGQLFGFIDHKGQFAIAPRFKLVNPFKDGLAVACIGDPFDATAFKLKRQQHAGRLRLDLQCDFFRFAAFSKLIGMSTVDVHQWLGEPDIKSVANCLEKYWLDQDHREDIEFVILFDRVVGYRLYCSEVADSSSLNAWITRNLPD